VSGQCHQIGRRSVPPTRPGTPTRKPRTHWPRCPMRTGASASGATPRCREIDLVEDDRAQRLRHAHQDSRLEARGAGGSKSTFPRSKPPSATTGVSGPTTCGVLLVGRRFVIIDPKQPQNIRTIVADNHRFGWKHVQSVEPAERGRAGTDVGNGFALSHQI
jgi:hypothetical protein